MPHRQYPIVKLISLCAITIFLGIVCHKLLYAQESEQPPEPPSLETLLDRFEGKNQDSANTQSIPKDSPRIASTKGLTPKMKSCLNLPLDPVALNPVSSDQQASPPPVPVRKENFRQEAQLYRPAQNLPAQNLPVAGKIYQTNRTSNGNRVVSNSNPIRNPGSGYPFPVASENMSVRSLPAIPNNNVAANMQTQPRGIPIFDDPVWWREQVSSQLGIASNSQSISLDELLYLTVRYSPKILAISQNPLIQETEIIKANAEFDPELFAKTRYDDRTDPVGNLLTTGGEPFLENKIWTANTGVRRKLAGGGSVDIQQKIGHENSNSQFFDPQDQGTATLSMNFSQPLMRGAGKFYNRSQIILAELGAGIAWDQFFEELQSELLDAYEAYWTLYYHRSVLLQKRRNVERGQKVLDRLQARDDFDTIPSQISRAKAAIQQRRTDLANAERDVKNAETEIRRITGNRNWRSAFGNEIVPVQSAAAFHIDRDFQQIVQNALDNRPEIRQAVKRAKAAAVAADVSRNELLPELTMVFGAYASGLDGDSDIATAWQEQFSATTPGFYGGLEITLPYRNRAARSRHDQRRLQLKQIRFEVDRVVQDVIADSQTALRRLNSAYQTSVWAYEAMQAAEMDLIQHERRWESFGLVEGDLTSGLTASTALNQLLDAQDRLANAELAYTQSIIDYKLAESALKKADGSLLQMDRISIMRLNQDCLPSLEVNRN